MTTFSEGTKARYQHYDGIIRFISDQYLTFCISGFPEEKSRDVCILIYPDEYEKITLVEDT